MKTKKGKASPSVLIVLIVAIVLVVSVTLAAIFRQTIDISRLLEVSNLKAESVVTFDGVANIEEYTDEYGIRASVDPYAPNYIGKLRASVRYSGRGVGLIRVRMVEEWSTPIYTSQTVTENVDGEDVQREVKVKTGRTVQPYPVLIPYTLPSGKTYDPENDSGNESKWFDNRLEDYCFYYATPVYSLGTSTVPLITGVDVFDLGLMPNSTEIHVMFETDVVQVNRYPQYWGISTLPWNDAASASEEPVSGVYSGEDVELPTDA